MTGLGWTVGETVDAVVTSDTVAASRPVPYLIFHAMEARGVTDVRRVLAAGDTPNDLAAGTNAGAGFVIGVTTGSFTRSQLETEPHTPHPRQRGRSADAIVMELRVVTDRGAAGRYWLDAPGRGPEGGDVGVAAV